MAAIILFYAVFSSAYGCDNTPDCIREAYENSLPDNKRNFGLGGSTLDSQNQSSSTGSPAADALVSAKSTSSSIIDLEEEQNKRVKKYNKAKPAEILYLYRSVDSTIKLGTVKHLSSDLLAAGIRNNILYTTIRLMSLEELFNKQIEKEFKKVGGK